MIPLCCQSPSSEQKDQENGAMNVITISKQLTKKGKRLNIIAHVVSVFYYEAMINSGPQS